MKNNIFETVLIIGMGLIGSSIARAIKKNKISSKIYGLDTNKNVLEKCKELDLLSDSKNDIEDFPFQFDLVIICSPLGTYKEVFASLNSFVNKFTLVTDVGSTKFCVQEDFKNYCNKLYRYGE